jgi:hypothetical protein
MYIIKDHPIPFQLRSTKILSISFLLGAVDHQTVLSIVQRVLEFHLIGLPCNRQRHGHKDERAK